MFCTKCGNEITDNAVFCDKCGASQEVSAKANETESTDANATPDATPNATPDTTPNAAPDITPSVTPNEPKRPNRKAAVIIAAVIALLLAGAFCVAIFGNFFIKTFSSPQSYYRHVETKALKAMAVDLATYYQLSLDQYLDAKTEGSMKLTWGEEIQELVELAELDLPWLDSLTVEVASNVKGGQAEVLYEIGLGDKGTLISANVAVDVMEKVFFMQVPELNEQYIGCDIADLYDDEMDDTFELWEMMVKAEDKLPSAAKVNQLLDKYIAIALEDVDQVEKGTETLEADGVSQECTTLKITFDDTQMKKMAGAVLTALAEDRELETIIKDIASVDDTVDPDDIYNDFLGNIEDILAEMENDELSGEGETMVMTVWVDDRDEIRGRSFTVENATYGYAIPVEEDKFGFSARLGDELELIGSGENSDDKLSGDFTFNYDDMNILELEIKDYDMKTVKEGYMNGNFILKPTDDTVTFFDYMGYYDLTSLFLGIEDYQLEMAVAESADRVSNKATLHKQGDLFLAFDVTGTTDGGGEVTMPDSQEAVDINDEEAVEAWLEGSDLEGYFALLVERFELSEEMASYLDMMLYYLDSSYVDEYYDDYSEEYYDEEYYDEEYYDDEYYSDEYYDDYSEDEYYDEYDSASSF